MSARNDAEVCVVIAAYKAAATIGRAVRSALAQPETREVIVVDDASPDGTSEAALLADDGSGRLRIERAAHNRGPSAARNLAIALSTAPCIAVLDADDAFLSGRLAPLLASEDWDFVADNIAFTPEEAAPPLLKPASEPRIWPLALDEFVASNTVVRGRSRRELGFLKPVMRRSFLDQHRLRYDETLWFGEDYDFYCRGLVAGARFKVISACGYWAVTHSKSLSHRQKAADLERLAGADQRLLGQGQLTASQRAIIARHRRGVLHQFWLRRFLDRKAQSGILPALSSIARDPSEFLAVFAGVARDKWEVALRSLPALSSRRQDNATHLLFDEGAPP